MKNWLFFAIGWIGGAVVGAVDGLPNKLMVTGVTFLVFLAAIIVSGLTKRGADGGNAAPEFSNFE